MGMSKKVKTLIVILVVLFIVISIVIVTQDKTELRTIKSEKQLLKMYEGEGYTGNELFINLLTMPFSFLVNGYRIRRSSIL